MLVVQYSLQTASPLQEQMPSEPLSLAIFEHLVLTALVALQPQSAT